MAKKIISASIATGLTIEAGHVTQSADAFTGTEAYDITISGSLDINNAPITNLTASGNISSSANVSAVKYLSGDKNLLSYTSATDTVVVNASLGNLFLAGNITASSTGQGNISASGDIIANNITAADEIRLSICGTVLDANNLALFQNQLKIGTDASITEIEIGSSSSSNRKIEIYGQITASANISASGQIVGNSFKVQQQLAGGGSDTSLIISGSTFDGDNRDAQIVYPNHGLHFNDDSGNNNHVLALQGNTVGIRMEPEGGGEALQVSGSIVVTDGQITASGDISGSSTTIFSGNQYKAIGGFQVMQAGDTLLNSDDLPILSHNNGVTPIITSLGSDDLGGTNLSQVQLITDQGEILAVSGSTVTVGPSATEYGTEALNVRGNISASGNGIFKAGKPITTHGTPFTASYGEAGFYHIVGGNLTCSISTSTAPVGAEYEFFQTSSGNFLFETGSGITLISKNDSIRLAQLGSSAVLKKITADTFHLMGDLT